MAPRERAADGKQGSLRLPDLLLDLPQAPPEIRQLPLVHEGVGNGPCSLGQAAGIRARLLVRAPSSSRFGTKVPDHWDKSVRVVGRWFRG